VPALTGRAERGFVPPLTPSRPAGGKDIVDDTQMRVIGSMEQIFL